MTKVSIIDVTLGARVKDIISDNVTALTGRARQELDTAIEERKRVEAVKVQREQDKKGDTDKITVLLESAYKELEQAGANGVVVDTIMDMVKEVVPNTSAFTLRMKKILKEKGDPYRIIRKKANGKHTYFFESFNVEIPQVQ